jgi:hypothetical protein
MIVNGARILYLKCDEREHCTAAFVICGQYREL